MKTIKFCVACGAPLRPEPAFECENCDSRLDTPKTWVEGQFKDDDTVSLYHAWWP